MSMKQLTGFLLLAYLVNSSSQSQEECAIPPIICWIILQLVGVTGGLLTTRASLKRAQVPSTLHLTPCKLAIYWWRNWWYWFRIFHQIELQPACVPSTMWQYFWQKQVATKGKSVVCIIQRAGLRKCIRYQSKHLKSGSWWCILLKSVYWCCSMY